MAASPVVAQDAGGTQSVTLTAPQLFAYADSARNAGDFVAAGTAYRALSSNPDADLRTEARFRLGMMLADQLHRYRDAAIEFRRILDEKPAAARVRLELARVQALLGNLSAARREIRAAEAAGLPPQVERMVRFYAAALKASKPLGGSFELSLAPDSNINRATRSDTLGTVWGNFQLNEDARARSGLGVTGRGQGYFRAQLDARTTMLARVNTSANLYRDPQFNDVSVGVEAGPEYMLGKDRLTVSVGPTWRWYGALPYSLAISANATLLKPLGGKAQLRLDGGIAHITNRRNPRQTGDAFSLSAGVDRAWSARFGGGVQASASRTNARDPGYSDVTGGVSVYAFREIGRTTAVASIGYSRLEADERLFLYPRRRVDHRFTAAISATWRALQWRGLAPLTRIRWERNRSTVGIYDYHRIAAEFGISSAF